MNGRVTRALYEEPSRWSRLVVICCTVVAALLTILIALPPLLSLVAYRSVTPQHTEIVGTASPDRTTATASLDESSQNSKPAPSAGIEPPQNAKPDASAANVPVTIESRVVTTEEEPRTVESSDTAAPPLAAQDLPPPMPTTDGQSTEKALASAPIQSTPAPGSALDADTELVARPPLPRARPHRVKLAGIAGIPLPPPRPVVPTDGAGTDREASHEHFDPI
jgi:hypothetical protein